ncbi:hypothetical protein OC861_000730 [Tilletia horrida]|nr:hypothetical protein OC861_000730 [Tilletia horrida]
MSDDEFLMDDGAEEDYDFEYEDEDGEEEADADIENKYYNAKALKEDDPDAAVRELKAVVELEPEKGEWGFKALKQQTKINFYRGRHTEALQTYTTLLSYTKSAVTRNTSEKAINNILDYVSNSPTLDLTTMQRFYDVTKTALEQSKNERLSIKTDLKLARLWLARQEWSRLSKTLKELHEYCVDEEGSNDQSKGTILLEVYALEIQMYGDQGNYKKLKETYTATQSVKSAIPHPRIQGVIRECGGKMHMAEKNWSAAQVDFFQSFLNYDEAGSPQRIQVLKYLVIAHMLMGSEIDPFDSQETKPYKNDPQITAMTDLVRAYQHREVHTAEKILKENHDTIMADPFIRQYIDDVLGGLRTQYLIDLIQPYQRIELSFLANHLNMTQDAVEHLLQTLILDSRVPGRIDQVNQRLLLRPSGPHSSASNSLTSQKYAALKRWVDALDGAGAEIGKKLVYAHAGGSSSGSGGGGGSGGAAAAAAAAAANFSGPGGSSGGLLLSPSASSNFGFAGPSGGLGGGGGLMTKG